VADPAVRLADHLQRSLDLLARESPAHLQRMRAALGDRPVVITIHGARPVRVSLNGTPPWTSIGGAADLEIALSQPDLFHFVRGEITLDEAVKTQRLQLRGRLDDLLILVDTLTAWSQGARRAPSLAKVRDSFLAG
jgi:hypothetical protein